VFEEKTFENILSDLLEYVSDRYPDLDTREGSIIYTALAPIALELETAYHEMEMILEETFLETASKEYLVKHGDQMGVSLNEATYGHFEGEFDVKLDVGTRFNLDKFNYNVIDLLNTIYEIDEAGSYKLDENGEKIPKYYIHELVCETEGTEPNGYFGDLTPITFVDNLSHAKLTSVIIYGEDEEDTEAYRYRLQIHTKNPPIDGNVAQYKEWLNDYDGIGKYDVVPCWNGKNTVKLIVLNPENTKASDELVDKVQNYFDPPKTTINDDTTAANYPQGRGMGNGQAPIGAIVTVNTVTETPVVINCQLKLKDKQASTKEVQDAVDKYLKSIALDKTTIGYMPISAEIYKVDNVEEVISLSITVNGTIMDTNVTPFVDSVTIDKDEIAVLDTINSKWGVQ
jgi:uncharacterized phage protein gp47/JayE